MKVRYTSSNGQLVFDVEAETAKDLFSQLGSIQDIFEAETKCGMCASVDIRFSARVVDEYEFYELACRSCRAQFRFGQKKKGGDLFPKRKDDAGNLLPHGGWSIWEPQSTSQPMPGPREESKVAAPLKSGISDFPTPANMQTTFDRLAEYVGLPMVPTTLPGCLAALEDRFKRAAAEHLFAVKIEEYRRGPGKADDAKALLRGLAASLMGISGKAA